MSYGVTYTERVVYSRTLKYPCAVTAGGRKYLRKAKVRFSIFPLPFSPFHFARFYIPPSRSAIQPYSERQVLLPISQRNIGSTPDRRAEITERAKANVCRPFSMLVRGGCRRDVDKRG